MKPWVAFLCLQLAMIAPQMCRCEPARGRIVGLLEHWATCANTPEVQAYNQLAQIVYEHVGSPLAGLGVYDPGSVNAQWGRDLGETALFVAALEGTRSQINWQPGRVGRAGGTALRAQPLLPENAESLAAKTAANPLPANGVFCRVMPAKYAEAFARGEGAIAGGGEVFISAAEDLAGIGTVAGAQRRLALFKDAAGTVPSMSGDTLVTFRIRDINKVGLRSPIQTVPPRGYGFVPGGRTGGGAREWLINNGTADELGIYDIQLTPLR